MRWRGRRQSTNVSDQRGGGSSGGMFRSPGGLSGGRNAGFRIPRGRASKRAGGGLGCGTIAIIGVVMYFLGINPMTILSQLGGGLGAGLGTSVNQSQQRPPINRQATKPRANDDAIAFMRTILGSTEEVWSGIFKSYGKPYSKPVLVLFTGKVQSACGFASSASGPFYCPGDSKIYIDLAFYEQLANKFGAKGDFAQAYVLAHEVGHHVQNIIGVLPQFNRERRRMGKIEANKMSVQVELQADCFAGVWGYYVQREGWLERGDLEEALVAASQIGDDSIQKRTQGYVVPESFSHGTSKQRRDWFSSGFKTGRLESCNSFR
ncbi:MAG: zinc metallopeptidase [Rhizobiaceae bacterium]|nr:zinc metallopeptidase [Rhizobiaceae bacterium]